MTDRDRSCCFTGHRPNRLPWLDDPSDLRCLALRRALWERILASRTQGHTRFLSGMALGVDLLCAELVTELAETEPEVQLIPVVPFPSQAARWKPAELQRYKNLLLRWREQMVVVSPAYHAGCYRLRNQYMVDHSSQIIAVYDGRPSGGTHQTLEYAHSRGLALEVLYAGPASR